MSLHQVCAFFGDNAFINSHFMATPYQGNITAEQDAYNFFLSQLQINMEYCFGRLVTRWGFLQKLAPQHFTIAKIMTTGVLYLCRMHNFCTDAILDWKGGLEPPPTYDDDAIFIRLNSGIPLQSQYTEELQRSFVRPSNLLDGGLHHDNAIRRIRRTQQRHHLRDVNEALPMLGKYFLRM